MTIAVIDASFVLTALLGETHGPADQFKQLLSDAEKQKTSVYGTQLLVTEVANGLRFSLKDPKTSSAVFAAFSRLPITVFELSSAHMGTVLALSYELGTTVYDTSYHVAALLLAGTLHTCDREYYKKAVGKGHIRLID